MDVQPEKSRFIIDRRHLVGASIGGFFVALIALLTTGHKPAPDPDADLVGIVSTALDRGQEFWKSQMPAGAYRPARVVIYTKSTESACGLALAGAGPFYCPGDELIYVDLSFLRAIRGDLARAYVIAHELGHHVQKLRGKLGGNSVTIELGADCYAGTWMRAEQLGHHLSGGDIPSALSEAAAVGDDRIRPGSSPETWTHGSAAQRVDAVARGIAGRCSP